MNITIINDCRDENAKGRQIARTSSLIEGNISFVGVNTDLEAAGNLIDILDSYQDHAGVILVNVAPRNGKSKKYKNGTPFGYFKYKNVLVLSSVEGLTLSLIKKLKVVDSIMVLDIPTVLEHWVMEGFVSEELRSHVINTQFRSYEFLPRAAAYLLEKDLLGEKLNIDEILNAPKAVWWVDNFGNCKTTLFKEDVKEGDIIDTRYGSFSYTDRLKDVVDDEISIITGSSGLGNSRFLEIVCQGKSASEKLGILSGADIV